MTDLSKTSRQCSMNKIHTSAKTSGLALFALIFYKSVLIYHIFTKFLIV